MNVMIIGGMTSGKTTVANHLVENYGFTRIALADKIKEIESKLDEDFFEAARIWFAAYPGFKENYVLQLTAKEILMRTQDIPREEPKPRKRLQYLGTEGGRKLISDSVWIDIVMHATAGKDRYVIDDVRFPNEFEAFDRAGWKAVRLEVSKEMQHKRLTELYGKYDPNILKHPSETAIQDIPVTDGQFVVNADTPLEKMLKEITDKLNLEVPVEDD